MSDVPSIVPALAVLVTLAATALISLSGRWPNLRELWSLLAGGVKLALVASLLPEVLAGRAASCELLTLVSGPDGSGVGLALRADAAGVFFALIASGLYILTVIYAIGYMRGNDEQRQTRFFAAFAVCLSSTIGIAFSANLLTFLLFYEILSIATYVLVIHKHSPAAIASGRLYLTYAISAGLALLVAVLWTYQLTGSLDFEAGGLLEGCGASALELQLLFALFIAGVGVKAGLMPLHSWLPAAMVAPTPVSALLHAVAVVKSGVFGVIRIVGFVFGPTLARELSLDIALAAVAGTTILVASLIALQADNLKRRLAYSTVGHLSYIVMGVALLTPLGLTGGILHMATHAFMKITLFFCAGAIYVHLKKQNISELDGVGYAMPWTMGAFAVGAVGLAGAPPVSGFVSKFLLCQGATQAGWPVVLGLLLLSGLLNAAYFFPIVWRAFFRPPPEGLAERGEASLLMVIPLLVTALMAMALCVWPDALFAFHELAQSITRAVLDGAGGGR